PPCNASIRSAKREATGCARMPLARFATRDAARAAGIRFATCRHRWVPVSACVRGRSQLGHRCARVLADHRRRWATPPPLFWQKRLQAAENKGPRVRKEGQEKKEAVSC